MLELREELLEGLLCVGVPDEEPLVCAAAGTGTVESVNNAALTRHTRVFWRPILSANFFSVYMFFPSQVINTWQDCWIIL